MRIRAAGHDDSADRDLLQQADIRPEFPHVLLAIELDQEIHPVSAGESNRSRDGCAEHGPFLVRGWFRADWLAGKIKLDALEAASCGQEAAPRLEPRRLASGQEPFLPQDMGRGQRGMAAEVHLRVGGKPAKAKRRFPIELTDVGRLREIHFRGHILHPSFLGWLGQDADGRGISTEAAIGESVNLGEALSHGFYLGELTDWGSWRAFRHTTDTTMPAGFVSAGASNLTRQAGPIHGTALALFRIYP